jgi:peptidoglycan/LPS O-acetylase OafA/YrhL
MSPTEFRRVDRWGRRCTTDGKEHLPALDGVRGFAASVVVVTHLAGQFWGALGVSLFFTLSGFLMAYLYASEDFSFAKTYAYGVSRFSRIAPAYLLVIVVAYCIHHFDSSFAYDINNQNLLRHLLFSGNVGVFWSIPPEVQFYIFFLFVWWSINHLSRGFRWPLVGVIGACLVMLYFGKQVPGTALPSKLTFFMMGTIAGLIRYHLPALIMLWLVLGMLQLASFVALLFYASFLYNVAANSNAFSGVPENALYGSLFYSFLCAITILLLSYSSEVADVLFANKPMRLLGAWSFSLYLIHQPVLQIAERFGVSGHLSREAAVGMGVTTSIVAAAFVYTCVEKPAQKSIKRLSGRVFHVISLKLSRR